MLVLALDAAMSACSAALWQAADLRAPRREARHQMIAGVTPAGAPEGRTLARVTRPMARGHAEALVPMVESVMAEGGRTYAEIDLIATTVGPGAFTGIRIGLAAARGIALAAQKPCAGVTTLEVLAAAARAGGSGAAPNDILAVVESRRADLFAQAFASSGLALGTAVALLPEGLAEFVRAAGLAPGFVLAGDGAVRAHAVLARAGVGARVCDSARVPDPALIAAIAADRHGQASALAPKPFYLRPPDVTFPKES
jgi:tRNA threonylcarbamoyladenosine biosynthesis protein TsaB